jgi:hypothetical protein
MKSIDNTTCLLGSSLEKDYLLFKRIVHHETPVVLALDNDAKNKTYNIALMLYEYGVQVKILSIPEQYNDLGQMNRNEFKEIVGTAKLMTSNELMRYKLNIVGN